jgi:toxin ParE1/3/4
VRVVFHERAKRELNELYDYISDQGSPNQAANFVGKIREYYLSFSTFPERGARRDDIEPGVRVIGFQRRVSIVFTVTEREVWILGIYYGGRNLGPPQFDEEEEPQP